MTGSFEGRTALVCGGSAGIGLGSAVAFARGGGRVALLSRSHGRLSDAAAEVERVSGRRPITIVGDVASEETAARSVEATLAAFGRLDVLVNNAGGPPPGSFLTHSLDAWDGAYRTNLMSAVTFTRAVVPSMRERGFGRIVNVTSIVGKEPSAPMVLSGVFRAGVSAFTKAVASELAPHGITINCVAPAAALTARAESLTRTTATHDGVTYEEALARAASAIPIKRFATLEEVAAAVLFFASEQASYVTGTTLMVDGGLSKGVF